MGPSANKLTDFTIGDRIELSPSTGAWMRGDRFGTIAKIGRKRLHIAMDKSQRTLTCDPMWVTIIEK